MKTYTEARGSILNGDVVFFSNGKKNLVRRLITWGTRGRFYHVGIAFWVNVDSIEPRLMLAESQPDGFRIVNLGSYSDRDMTVIRTDALWHDIARVTVDSAGAVNYDWRDLIAIGLHERLGVALPRSSAAGFVCSAIVSSILRGAGVTGIDAMVSPQRLFEQLSKNYQTVLFTER